MILYLLTYSLIYVLVDLLAANEADLRTKKNFLSQSVHNMGKIAFQDFRTTAYLIHCTRPSCANYPTHNNENSNCPLRIMNEDEWGDL